MCAGDPPATVGGMSRPGDVPPAILDRLRSICAVLPEAYEEPAWIGVPTVIDHDREGLLVAASSAARAAAGLSAAAAGGTPPVPTGSRRA